MSDLSSAVVFDHRRGLFCITRHLAFQAPARFVLYYSKMSNRGSFEVWVDDVLVTTINAYNATTLWQQIYTSPMYSDIEPNVVTIKKVGSGRIDVAAIRIGWMVLLPFRPIFPVAFSYGSLNVQVRVIL